MSTIFSLIFTIISFTVITMFLPGFKVKDNNTIFIVAIVYSVIHWGISLVTLPIFVIAATFFIGLLALIPVIGPILAAIAALPTILAGFLLGFFVSIIVLIITDKLMDDFEMESFWTAILAAIALGGINLVFSIIKYILF